jgi:hypothetical protein
MSRMMQGEQWLKKIEIVLYAAFLIHLLHGAGEKPPQTNIGVPLLPQGLE